MLPMAVILPTVFKGIPVSHPRAIVARFDPSPNAPQDGDMLSPGLLTRFSTGAFLLPQVSLPFVLEVGYVQEGIKVHVVSGQ